MEEGEPPEDHATAPLSGEDLAEIAVASSVAAAPSLADFLLHGSGIPMALAGGAFMAVINRFTINQTQALIEELRRRIAALERTAKLDRGRLDRLEASAFYPAVAANAVSAPRKTALYADLLAGAVSVDAPDDVDVESFVTTLQSLTPGEIELARQVHDLYEQNPAPVTFYPSVDSTYLYKRLEGAGLIAAQLQTGPPGAGLRTVGYEPTPTLTRLIELLRSGRAGL